MSCSLLGAAAIEPRRLVTDGAAPLDRGKPRCVYTAARANSIARAWAAPRPARCRRSRRPSARPRRRRRCPGRRTGSASCGPDHQREAVGIRHTRAVVNTLVANATESLVLVSFASYKVDELVASAWQRPDRGVEVSLILETHDDSGGGLTVDAAEAFPACRARRASTAGPSRPARSVLRRDRPSPRQVRHRRPRRRRSSPAPTSPRGHQRQHRARRARSKPDRCRRSSTVISPCSIEEGTLQLVH